MQTPDPGEKNRLAGLETGLSEIGILFNVQADKPGTVEPGPGNNHDQAAAGSDDADRAPENAVDGASAPAPAEKRQQLPIQ